MYYNHLFTYLIVFEHTKVGEVGIISQLMIYRKYKGR